MAGLRTGWRACERCALCGAGEGRPAGGDGAGLLGYLPEGLLRWDRGHQGRPEPQVSVAHALNRRHRGISASLVHTVRSRPARAGARAREAQRVGSGFRSLCLDSRSLGLKPVVSCSGPQCCRVWVGQRNCSPHLVGAAGRLLEAAAALVMDKIFSGSSWPGTHQAPEAGLERLTLLLT